MSTALFSLVRVGIKAARGSTARAAASKADPKQNPRRCNASIQLWAQGREIRPGPPTLLDAARTVRDVAFMPDRRIGAMKDARNGRAENEPPASGEKWLKLQSFYE